MNILFLVPYPTDEAPSQRFRFEQYYSILTEAGHTYSTQSFFTLEGWRSLYTGSGLKKVFLISLGLLRRFFILFLVHRYQIIFIHREVTPVGPPIIEWFIAKILRKKIIYDFDDAIWLTDKISETTVEKIIRWRSKANSICRWSYKVSAGNEYLALYGNKFNTASVVNPTTIDTEHLHNKKLYTVNKKEGPLIIGWTGSHSTLKYWENLLPILKLIEEKYIHVSFHVIADKPPSTNFKNLIFKQWSKENEIRDMLEFDIGIMPLPDDEWTKGKCGFKALQYMALDIPCIASPVGVNTTIIQHGVNGLLCNSGEEWITSFDMLITHELMRKELGQRGRKTVEKNYSVYSNSSNFLSLFE